MTNDELNAIEERMKYWPVEVTVGDAQALVAEVRRLRVLTDALEERVAMYEGRRRPLVETWVEKFDELMRDRS